MYGITIVDIPQGGMKAVLWADTAQMVIMLGGILAVIIQGTISVGGMGKVWQIAEDGGRINFKYSNIYYLV